MPVGRFAVDCVEGGVESKVASEEDLGNTNMVANSLGWAKLFDKQANKKAKQDKGGTLHKLAPPGAPCALIYRGGQYHLKMAESNLSTENLGCAPSSFTTSYFMYPP